MNLCPHDFTHQSCPPEGYSYEYSEFKRNVVAIWLRNHSTFSYTNEPVRTIWGMAKRNKNGSTTYYAPVNSKKMGKEVRLSDTRNFTAMPLNLNPLEAAFL